MPRGCAEKEGGEGVTRVIAVSVHSPLLGLKSDEGVAEECEECRKCEEGVHEGVRSES